MGAGLRGWHFYFDIGRGGIVDSGWQVETALRIIRQGERKNIIIFSLNTGGWEGPRWVLGGGMISYR